MSSRRLGVAVLALVALLGLARTSSATTFGVESAFGLNFGCTATSSPACQPDDLISNACCFAMTTGTGVLSFGPQTFTNPVTGFTNTFAAQAQSSYGSLHASADASYSRSPTATDSRFLYASSIFRELLTVNSVEFDGQPGTLTITFDLDGTIVKTGTSNAFAYVGLQGGTVDNPEFYNEDFFPFLSQAEVDGSSVSLTVDIVYGREFLLSAVLGVFAGSVELCPEVEIGTSSCPSPTGVRGVPATGVGSGSALFSNSLNLTALTTNPSVTDASFRSGSGTLYDANGVIPTPEPGSLVLVGTGLAVAARRWRQRRRLAS